MIKLIKPRVLSFLFLPTNVFDTPKNPGKTNESEIKVESGWHRVKKMFEIDEFGSLSKEVISILHVAGMSTFIGAFYGGVNNSRVAYMDFIRNNQATAFHDHLEAKKKLQEKVTLSFARGAWKWSWRLTLFCTSFISICTIISVYRGKSGIIEYTTAGLATGTLYKFNLGPRGWIVGGGVGLVLGTIAGGVTLGLLKLTGMSMDEARYWQYYWQQNRREHMNRGIAKALEADETEVMKLHARKTKNVASDQEMLRNIDSNPSDNTK